MKIISGKYKGRIIDGHNLVGTRPTMDRVKESLFATIQAYIPDSIVLDLFSGTGNLALEALSEGAKKSYLVDSSKKALSIIRKNIASLNIPSSDAEVVALDYQQALATFKNQNLQFDLIFLDPPYMTNYIENSLKLINKYNLLSSGGLIVCESNNLDKIIYKENYQSIKEKKYGDKYIVLLKKVC